ncbi:MAG: hypothetical protein RR620_07420 [Clostridium sp.]
MEQNILSFREDEILEQVQSKKKNTGISISSFEILDNIKVHGKISRGINIEFDVICDIEDVTENDIIVNLVKIKILGLPLSKSMIMKYLESNFKTSKAKFKDGKILLDKVAVANKIPNLKGLNIQDIYIQNKMINIKTGEAQEYSIG